MDIRSFKTARLFFCCLAALVPAAGPLRADEVLEAAGRGLTPSQAKFVSSKVDSLRNADHLRRFAAVVDLIRLGAPAVPFLEDAVRRGSNPIPVRCALLVLSEIDSPEGVPLLAGVVKGTKKGRDEKAIALLGLGKRGSPREAALLRKMLARGENRLLRRSAALALGRLHDAESLGPLLTFAAREREERVAVTFILAAALAGGEEYAVKASKLFKTMKKGRRLAALLLGSAFEGDPVLKKDLMKCAGRDPRCDRALAVCLGLYHGEDVEAFLEKTALAPGDPVAAADALYSLVASAGGRAVPVLEKVFGLTGKEGSLRAHALLAAAGGGLEDPFRDKALEALSDSRPLVRSAAALALAVFGDRGAPPLVEKALKKEKNPSAARDMILAVGLLGNPQDSGSLAAFAAGTRDPHLAAAALLARKVLSGKTERIILEEELSRRLSDLSGRWSRRFRDAFMDMVRYGMDLDTIVRRSGDESSSDEGGDSSQGGDEQGGEGGEGGQGGGGEGGEGGGGGTEPQGPPEGPPPEGPPVGQIPGGAGQGGGGTPPPPGTFPGGSRRRFILRGEVVEWDILGWFDGLDYFPESFFARVP